MEERIKECIKNAFHIETADNTCSQKNCEQWDSMGQLNLVVELETEFEVSLEPEDIGEMKSFEDIARILRAKGVE